MHLVYIDESGTFCDGSFVKDQSWLPKNARESTHFVVVGIIIDTNIWKKTFLHLKKLRKNIKQIYDIPLSEFLHAARLVAGLDKWKHISRKSFDRPKRVRLLKSILHEYGQWSDIKLIAVAVNKTNTKFRSINPSTCRVLAYESLLNRIDKSINDEYILIHDGAEDLAIIRMVRKLQVINMINKINRPIQKITEDPLFKRGSHSYFLQMADHIAYSLLHLCDKRSNSDISRFVIDSKIFEKIGFSKACKYTERKLPGFVPIPTPKRN